MCKGVCFDQNRPANGPERFVAENGFPGVHIGGDLLRERPDPLQKQCNRLVVLRKIEQYTGRFFPVFEEKWIKGFAVAVLGGLGNSTGAVVAGIMLGIFESFSIWVMPTAYKDAIAISLLLVILFVRPSGLFGSREMSSLKEF